MGNVSLNTELPITGVRLCDTFGNSLSDNNERNNLRQKVCETFCNWKVTEQRVDNWPHVFLRG